MNHHIISESFISCHNTGAADIVHYIDKVTAIMDMANVKNFDIWIKPAYRGSCEIIPDEEFNKITFTILPIYYMSIQSDPFEPAINAKCIYNFKDKVGDVTIGFKTLEDYSSWVLQSMYHQLGYL